MTKVRRRVERVGRVTGSFVWEIFTYESRSPLRSLTVTRCAGYVAYV